LFLRHAIFQKKTGIFITPI